MKRTYLAILGVASMALAFGTVHAANEKDKDTPGFNELDKDNDGKLTKAEAAGNPALAARFAEVDTDNDGSISRMEYLKVMAQEDFRTLREKTADVVAPDDKSKSSTGSGASRGATK
jgi:Ca2+-binding EF-hand superfamily protein